ncbi:Deoxyribodipyrimidine photo-lyase [Phytophthora cinnamomi]|uniref:Deoxyribodipyrimidine photo-lyase n=1 Tax=Phytophthora cinnamomi TaxID=4785 RepID=UPI003559DE68|nr:Deoxyribodipyrimidine photo-lyase [Phytophthora cinnamomi]
MLAKVNSAYAVSNANKHDHNNLQAGVSEGADDPDLVDSLSAEEQTLRDLQRATSPTAKSSTSTGSTLETQALATVGRQRVQQLEAICARYERQLVGSEAALSQAIFSDAARESAAKITQLESRNLQHEADKQALEIQLELARGQVAHLQDQLTQTQERRTTLEHVKRRLEQQLASHTAATQQFASDLLVELRRRYGVVPSVLELKWQHYFPRLSRPF